MGAASFCCFISCWCLRRARSTSLMRVAGTQMPTRDSAVISVWEILVLMDVFDVGEATREAFAAGLVIMVLPTARGELRLVGDWVELILWTMLSLS